MVQSLAVVNEFQLHVYLAARLGNPSFQWEIGPTSWDLSLNGWQASSDSTTFTFDKSSPGVVYLKFHSSSEDKKMAPCVGLEMEARGDWPTTSDPTIWSLPSTCLKKNHGILPWRYKGLSVSFSIKTDTTNTITIITTTTSTTSKGSTKCRGGTCSEEKKMTTLHLSFPATGFF